MSKTKGKLPIWLIKFISQIFGISVYFNLPEAILIEKEMNLEEKYIKYPFQPDIDFKAYLYTQQRDEINVSDVLDKRFCQICSDSFNDWIKENTHLFHRIERGTEETNEIIYCFRFFVEK